MKTKSMLMAVALLAAGTATAAPIAIPVANQSFDSDVLDNGKWKGQMATNWGHTGAWYGVANPLGTTEATVGDKMINAEGDNPSLGGTGPNIIYQYAGAIFQSIGTNDATLQAGSYTLTVAVGRLKNISSATGGYSLYLADVAGNISNSYSSTESLPDGALVDRSVTLTVPNGSPYIGNQLYIAIAVLDGTGGDAFDNVRLDYSSPVPEPTMLGLLLAGLLGCAGRKRK